MSATRPASAAEHHPVPSPLRPPPLPVIEHAVGLPPGATTSPAPADWLVAELLRIQRAGIGYAEGVQATAPRSYSDELEWFAVYWEAQRVAAVTNSAADEANWQLHQIRIKRDALRAKGRVS